MNDPRYVHIRATPSLAARWARTIDQVCFPKAFGEPSSEDLAELSKIREQILDDPRARDLGERVTA